MFKSFLNKLLSSTSPFEYSSKTGHLFCPIHPNKAITQFCLHKNCNTPYMCSQCSLQHPKSHTTSFISFSELYDNQLILKFKQSREIRRHPTIDLVKASYNQIAVIIHNIRIDDPRELQTIQKKADEWQDTLINYHIQSQKAFRSYNPLIKAISNKTNLNHHQIHLLVNHYRTLQYSLTTLQKEYTSGLKKIIYDIKGAAVTSDNQNWSQYVLLLDRLLHRQVTDFSKITSNIPLAMPHDTIIKRASTFLPKFGLLAIYIERPGESCVALVDIITQTSRALISYGDSEVSSLVWIEERNCLLLCSSMTDIAVMFVSDNGNVVRHAGTLRCHDRIMSIKYIRGEDLLVTLSFRNEAVVWSMRTLRRIRRIISRSGFVHSPASLIYIPESKLMGFGVILQMTSTIRPEQPYLINFSGLLSSARNFLVEVKEGRSNNITGLCYLPKNKLIVTSLDTMKLKIWKYDEHTNKVTVYRTVEVGIKRTHSSTILCNEDESQLVFLLKSGEMAIYSIHTNKIGIIDEYRGEELVMLEGYGKVLLVENWMKARILSFGVV